MLENPRPCFSKHEQRRARPHVVPERKLDSHVNVSNMSKMVVSPAFFALVPRRVPCFLAVYRGRHVRGYRAGALPGPRGRSRPHGGTGRGLGGDAEAEEGVRRRDNRGPAGGLRGGATGRKARLVVPGFVMIMMVVFHGLVSQPWSMSIQQLCTLRLKRPLRICGF